MQKLNFFPGKSHNKCERAEDIKISIFEMQMEYKYLHKHEQLAKRMESTERPSADSLGTEGQPGRSVPYANYTIEKYPVRVAQHIEYDKLHYIETFANVKVMEQLLEFVNLTYNSSLNIHALIMDSLQLFPCNGYPAKS